ncbi:MAG: energy transducer TonB, partial [Spirochaetia bacterium]
GVVLYRVSVNADGKIDGIELIRSSGFPVLDQAAREAVMRTAFVPAFWMNRPLADQVTIRIKFELKQ